MAWHGEAINGVAITCRHVLAPCPAERSYHVPHYCLPCLCRSDKKVEAEWTPQMEAEATHYYLTNYIGELRIINYDEALNQHFTK